MAVEPWTCPFCDRDVLIDTDHSTASGNLFLKLANADGYRRLMTRFTVCPNRDCRRTALRAVLVETQGMRAANGALSYPDVEVLKGWTLVPTSNAKPFPSYVPAAIREDYEEACEIREGSPKAAATLARRALQGMLRDFWRVKPGRLVDEIDEVKTKLEPEVWDALDAVRSVGNIGAHMEKDVNLIIDVEPSEAETLIGLIEMLIKEWYVARENRKASLAGVKAIAASKAAAKVTPTPKPPSKPKP